MMSWASQARIGLREPAKSTISLAIQTNIPLQFKSITHC